MDIHHKTDQVSGNEYGNIDLKILVESLHRQLVTSLLMFYKYQLLEIDLGILSVRKMVLNNLSENLESKLPSDRYTIPKLIEFYVEVTGNRNIVGLVNTLGEERIAAMSIEEIEQLFIQILGAENINSFKKELHEILLYIKDSNQTGHNSNALL